MDSMTCTYVESPANRTCFFSDWISLLGTGVSASAALHDDLINFTVFSHGLWLDASLLHPSSYRYLLYSQVSCLVEGWGDQQSTPGIPGRFQMCCLTKNPPQSRERAMFLKGHFLPGIP